MKNVRIKGASLAKLLGQAVSAVGENSVRVLLETAAAPKQTASDCLTIMANEGLHTIPSRFIHGELYIASLGNLVYDSPKGIVSQYRRILSRIRAKLTERDWKRIYLIPTGHPTLSLQIKNLVYHVLRMDTIDLFYSNGKYFELDISRASYLKERFH